MEKRFCVDKDLADTIQLMLDMDKQVSDARRDAVLHVFTVDFDDGIEADIKVCNGDTGPWIDAVLFEFGHEVQVLEPSTILLGEYLFELCGQPYTARLEAEYGHAED